MYCKQARAKLELREEATGYDAIDVVELMRWSMVDTLSDEFGMLDFQRSEHGSGMSTKNQVNYLFDQILVNDLFVNLIFCY